MTETPKQRYQGVQKESAGYRLLASMGWKEGEGLGVSKQGIKEHIRVKKKFENWGVGATEAAERARDWSTGMVEFHRVLSTLSEINSQHASKHGDASIEEESDASDGDLETKQNADSVATKRKNDRASVDEKKRKRKSKSSECKSTRGEDSSEGIIPAATPVKRVKLATHLGRFKKRESAKMVQNYSEHDLAAILGGDPFAAAAAAVGEVHTARDVVDEDVSSDIDSGDDRSDQGGAEPIVTLRQSNKFDEEKQACIDAGEQDEDARDDGYWWSSYFVKGGRMGSLRRANRSKARGFSEQDQTDLYTRVRDGVTQGRVGLGRSSLPKKVGGARWQGKKVTFGSDSEGYDEQEGKSEKIKSDSNEEVEIDELKGVVIMKPRVPAARAQAQEKATAPASSEVGAIKWKRTVVEILKQNASKMKLKAVVRAVMERRGLGKTHKAEVTRNVNVCVQSSKFQVQGKTVRLANGV